MERGDLLSSDCGTKEVHVATGVGSVMDDRPSERIAFPHYLPNRAAHFIALVFEMSIWGPRTCGHTECTSRVRDSTDGGDCHVAGGVDYLHGLCALMVNIATINVFFGSRMPSSIHLRQSTAPRSYLFRGLFLFRAIVEHDEHKNIRAAPPAGRQRPMAPTAP